MQGCSRSIQSERSSVRRCSQPSNDSAAARARTGSVSPSAIRSRRAARSSSNDIGSVSPVRWRSSPACRRCDQRLRLDGGIEIEVGHRRPLEHLASVGRCNVERTIQGAFVGESEERHTVCVVVEQCLDQPLRDRVPLLHEQHEGSELRVLHRTGLALGRDVDGRAACSSLGQLDEVGDRQPDLCGDLAGVELADVRVRMLVDDRHAPLRRGATRCSGESSRVTPSFAADGTEERQRLVDGLRQRLGIAIGEVARVLPGRAGGRPTPRPGASAPTRRSARRHPARPHRRRTTAPPDWRTA